MSLLTTSSIDASPHDFIQNTGAVFACFGANSQDSGNVSYGVRVDNCSYFVKTAGFPNAPLADPASPTHPQRMDLLHNAVAVSKSLDHPALPDLYNVIESPEGPILVYEWVPGELVRSSGDAVDGPLLRFKSLSIETLLDAMNTIYAVFELIDAAGWITEDFYDGCVIYDFTTADLHIVDLDHSHPGPFTNTMGRMFGSSRFMAPEEFVKGAQIDRRTTSFLLGRIAAVFLSDNSLDREPFRGTDPQHRVIVKACSPDPNDRFQTPPEFLAAWRSTL